MSFQAYLDNIQAKTGKTPDDFRVLAAEKNLAQYRELMAWLKSDYGLGHGYANAIAQLLVHPDARKIKPDDKVAKLFAGNKQKWRKTYDALVARLSQFGDDVKVAPTNTYISLLRGSKKFGVVQPAAAEHLDIGIKRKGVAPTKRFQAAGTWNNMVTHRLRVTDPKQIDKEVLAWLKRAYDAASGEITMKTMRHHVSESNLPIELAQPARRALAAAGYTRLEQLAMLNEAQVKQLHGIGPNALHQLRRALSAKGLSFADETKR